MAIYEKKNCHRSSAYIYHGFKYNHTNVGYYNISSKIDFQGAGQKVKVTVAIFRKIKLCYGSSAYIFTWILIFHTNIQYDNIKQV